MKIAIIACYQQQNYVRARTLRAAFTAAEGVEVIDIRNQQVSALRFIEVPLKIMWTRWRDKPDAYVVTFRGYEMLLFMRLTLVHRPIIFDELINFTEWMEEHKRLRSGTLRYRWFRRWYSWLVRHCRFILADTAAHADYSAHLNHLAISRYRTIPVGTDETVFSPPTKPLAKTEPFTVFYYGHMLPLHGLSYLLEAAVLLRDNPQIQFQIVGGKARSRTAAACQAAIEQGARISYQRWIPFEELPAAALAAGLTVGGPFGDTLQSQFVITGKTYQFLALGAPVLIGRNRVTELFQDKVNCLMVPQADPQALAQTISWAQQQPKELQRIGRAGHQLYEQYFSQAHINTQVQQLIADLQTGTDQAQSV
jgi:glycosyltransferase involved in cell wall biosynthesis